MCLWSRRINSLLSMCVEKIILYKHIYWEFTYIYIDVLETVACTWHPKPWWIIKKHVQSEFCCFLCIRLESIHQNTHPLSYLSPNINNNGQQYAALEYVCGHTGLSWQLERSILRLAIWARNSAYGCTNTLPCTRHTNIAQHKMNTKIGDTTRKEERIFIAHNWY